MPKHNNVIPNVHLHKEWERFVKTWFDQAAKKKTRRLKRIAKARKIFPRPIQGPLRPLVHGQTQKYNMKIIEGRGFSLEELKLAGVNRHLARTIGISVDHRRRNRTETTLQENVQRLKTYMSKLIIFPKKVKASRRRDLIRNAKRKGVAAPTFPQPPVVQQHKGPILPAKKVAAKAAWRQITDADRKAPPAFLLLRQARADARLVGIRKKKAAEKAAALIGKK